MESYLSLSLRSRLGLLPQRLCLLELLLLCSSVRRRSRSLSCCLSLRRRSLSCCLSLRRRLAGPCLGGGLRRRRSTSCWRVEILRV